MSGWVRGTSSIRSFVVLSCPHYLTHSSGGGITGVPDGANAPTTYRHPARSALIHVLLTAKTALIQLLLTARTALIQLLLTARTARCTQCCVTQRVCLDTRSCSREAA